MISIKKRSSLTAKAVRYADKAVRYADKAVRQANKAVRQIDKAVRHTAKAVRHTAEAVRHAAEAVRQADKGDGKFLLRLADCTARGSCSLPAFVQLERADVLRAD